MSAFVPPWLQQASVQQGVQQQPQVLAVAPTRTRAVEPTAQAPDSYGFAVPPGWPWDGGVRREAVLDCDHKPVRVVRCIGWRSCMKCTQPFFSADVVKVRMCSARKP